MDRWFLLFALTPPRSTSAGERAQEIADATLARLDRWTSTAWCSTTSTDESGAQPGRAAVPLHADPRPGRLPGRQPPRLGGPGHRLPRGRQVLRAPSSGHGSRTRIPPRVLTVLVGAAQQRHPADDVAAEPKRCGHEANPDCCSAVSRYPNGTAAARTNTAALAKQAAGCRFFVTQVVYDVNAAKNLVSDYHYACAARGPSPRRSSSRSRCAARCGRSSSCAGSASTFRAGSRTTSDTRPTRWRRPTGWRARTATELIAYCRDLGVPFGINVESVSIRRVEIETAVRSLPGSGPNSAARERLQLTMPEEGLEPPTRGL